MISQDDTLDVLVRFHNPDRLVFLERALFSLACQTYAPVNVYVLTQRFSEDELIKINNSIGKFRDINNVIQWKCCNYNLNEPTDARSAILNMGLSASQGRFLAILDYDDAIYATGYTKLVAELKKSGAAIAFGKILVKREIAYEHVNVTTQTLDCFQGRDLRDLFIDNFCPIHSFIIDRQNIDREDLFFETNLVRLEDYQFLIKFCAKYVSSFACLNEPVGCYFIRNDGTNSVLTEGSNSRANIDCWGDARNAIELCKNAVVLDKEVQNAYGIVPYIENLTVNEFSKNTI